MYEEVIASRTVGQYPLSVATSLAIESANGIHPEIVVDSPPIRRFDELWVNLRTLYRNFVGALPKERARVVPSEESAHALMQEMEQIAQLVRCPVVFYVSNYKDIDVRYPHATIRMDSTDNQRLYTSMQHETLEVLLKLNPPQKVLGFELKIHPEKPQTKALLLTHYPYDLLSSRSFGDLVLLESHTGRIKERAEWYTKYYQGKDLPPLPFREDLIQVFGDAEHFRPMDLKLRHALLEIAKQYNWTAITTYSKLIYGIEQLQNPYYTAFMKELMSRTYGH